MLIPLPERGGWAVGQVLSDHPSLGPLLAVFDRIADRADAESALSGEPAFVKHLTESAVDDWEHGGNAALTVPWPPALRITSAGVDVVKRYDGERAVPRAQTDRFRDAWPMWCGGAEVEIAFYVEGRTDVPDHALADLELCGYDRYLLAVEVHRELFGEPPAETGPQPDPHRPDP